MKYILTLLTAAFTLSACCSTKCDTKPGASCPHGKAKSDQCCADKPAKKRM